MYVALNTTNGVVGQAPNSGGALPLIFCIHVHSKPIYWRGYRRFIAGPTLNNSKKEVGIFFGNCHLMLLKLFGDFLVIFWKLSLNVVENVAKVETLFNFFFFCRMQIFHFN